MPRIGPQEFEKFCDHVSSVITLARCDHVSTLSLTRQSAHGSIPSRCEPRWGCRCFLPLKLLFPIDGTYRTWSGPLVRSLLVVPAASNSPRCSSPVLSAAHVASGASVLQASTGIWACVDNIAARSEGATAAMDRQMAQVDSYFASSFTEHRLVFSNATRVVA